MCYPNILPNSAYSRSADLSHDIGDAAFRRKGHEDLPEKDGRAVFFYCKLPYSVETEKGTPPELWSRMFGICHSSVRELFSYSVSRETVSGRLDLIGDSFFVFPHIIYQLYPSKPKKSNPAVILPPLHPNREYVV